MKKEPSKGPGKNPYVCRKCGEDKFRKWMEFTRHLKKCKPPAPTSPIETVLTMMGSMQQKSIQHLETARGKKDAELISLLVEVSQRAGDLKTAVDQVIKRLA